MKASACSNKLRLRQLKLTIYSRSNTLTQIVVYALYNFNSSFFLEATESVILWFSGYDNFLSSIIQVFISLLFQSRACGISWRNILFQSRPKEIVQYKNFFKHCIGVIPFNHRQMRKELIDQMYLLMITVGEIFFEILRRCAFCKKKDKTIF